MSEHSTTEQPAAPADGKNKSKAKEIEEGKSMAILAYIIALIPFFAGDKKNKFVRFHAVQGMNILIIAVGYSIIASILSSILGGIFLGGCLNAWSYWVTGQSSGGMCNPGLYGIISFIVWIPAIIIGIIDIIGLISAINGKEKEVPILGKFKIIKE